MTIREQLIDEWDREITLARHVLCSASQLDPTWVPPGETRSVCRVMQQLARVPSWGPLVLDRFVFDLEQEPPLDPAAPFVSMLQSFETAAELTRRLINQSDSEWRAIWSLTRGGKPQFSMPRITAFRRFVSSRLIHRRGELSVYLGAAGMSSPVFYVPALDEN